MSAFATSVGGGRGRPGAGVVRRSEVFAFTYAVQYDGRRESLRGIEETIYAAAYEASTVQRPRALVVGVGGGFDVLTALYYDAAEVVGVEVNEATLRILKETHHDYFGPWVRDPRVRLVHGEAAVPVYVAAAAALSDSARAA